MRRIIATGRVVAVDLAATWHPKRSRRVNPTRRHGTHRRGHLRPEMIRPGALDAHKPSRHRVDAGSNCARVFFMMPGLALFYGGLVGEKNVIATMAQSFVAIGIVSVLWITVGYSLAFGTDHWAIIGGLNHILLHRHRRHPQQMGAIHPGAFVHGLPDDVRGHSPSPHRRRLRPESACTSALPAVHWAVVRSSFTPPSPTGSGAAGSSAPPA